MSDIIVTEQHRVLQKKAHALLLREDKLAAAVRATEEERAALDADKEVMLQEFAVIMNIPRNGNGKGKAK